jgi:basic membrane protein A
MLKRVDIAVHQTFTDAMNGDFTPSGFEVLGLAEGGVGWALDDNNAELITDEMKAAVEEATNEDRLRRGRRARLHV